MKKYHVTLDTPITYDQKLRLIPNGAGGPYKLANKNILNAVAKARAKDAGFMGQAYAETADFSDDSQFAYISGLTYCIGIIIAEKEGIGDNIVKVSVAHYNGGWEKTTGLEDQICSFGSGAKSGVILASACSTQYDVVLLKDFKRRMIMQGIESNNILFYWSKIGRLNFGICQDGSVGELENGAWENDVIIPSVKKKRGRCCLL